MKSLIIPVYKNEANIPRLLDCVATLVSKEKRGYEIVFVVDGSPDNSYEILKELLPPKKFKFTLVRLARNFGSFSAIRAGLENARGKLFAVMAADMQEPIELIENFFLCLETNQCDIAVGQRIDRKDALISSMAANFFWRLYRRLINDTIPAGGVDVFACNLAVRNQILSLKESHSSLVGLLFWVGYRRLIIPYERRRRLEGKSAWTLRKKVKYFADSVFSFSDLPIRLLLFFGMSGLFASGLLSILVLVAKISDRIPIPGYAGTILVITFFMGLNSLGLGIIGSYVWRTYENTKNRPNYIVMDVIRG